MAESITFPYTTLLDDYDFTEVVFRAPPIQEYSQRNSGRIDVLDLGPAIWRADVRSGTLTQDDALNLQTDLETIQGLLETVKLWDLRRPAPLHNPTVDDSTFTVSEVDTDRDRIKITNFPENMETAKGDYIQIEDGTNTYLLKAARYHDHSGAGTSSWIPIQPTVPLPITAGDTVKMVKAGALFTIDPDSINVTQAGGSFGYTVNFSATQSIE